MGFLEEPRTDLVGMDVRRDRQDRRPTAVGIVEALEKVDAAGSGAAGTYREPAGQLRLGSRRERGRFLVLDRDPLDARGAPDGIHDRVEAVTHDPVDPGHFRLNQHLDELLGDVHGLSLSTHPDSTASAGSNKAGVTGSTSGTHQRTYRWQPGGGGLLPDRLPTSPNTAGPGEQPRLSRNRVRPRTATTTPGSPSGGDQTSAQAAPQLAKRHGPAGLSGPGPIEDASPDDEPASLDLRTVAAIAATIIGLTLAARRRRT